MTAGTATATRRLSVNLNLSSFSTAVPNTGNLAAKFFHDTNAYRAVHAIPKLTYDPGLMIAARVRAVDLRLFDFLEHKGSDGRSYTETVRRYAPKAVEKGVSENIGSWKDPNHARDAWHALNVLIGALQLSQGHKHNWLDTKWTHLGVGVSYMPGVMYVVQVFSKGV